MKSSFKDSAEFPQMERESKWVSYNSDLTEGSRTVEQTRPGVIKATFDEAGLQRERLYTR